MVKDDGKYYTILKVCPLKKTSDKEEESWEEMKSNSGKEEKLKSGKEIKSGKRTEMWSEPELKYGRFLLQNRNPVLREYLQREILIREQILAGLDGKENRRIEQRRTELKKNWKKHRKGWIIMQCKEIMQVIEATYPRTAALDFDNVGLLAGRADKGSEPGLPGTGCNRPGDRTCDRGRSRYAYHASSVTFFSRKESDRRRFYYTEDRKADPE